MLVFSFLKLPAAPRSGISATLQQAAGNALAVAVQGSGYFYLLNRYMDNALYKTG